MKRNIFTIGVVLSVVAGVPACTPNHATFDSAATVRSKGDSCEITVTGLMPDMVHGPLTFLLRGQSRMKGIYLVPNATGAIDASQVQVSYWYESGKVRPVTMNLSGSVHMADSAVTISLQFHDAGTREVRPDLFNGHYTIAGANACKANQPLHPDASRASAPRRR